MARMRICLCGIVASILVACLAPFAAAQNEAAGAPALGRWERLPLPEEAGRPAAVDHMVMEPGGTVWITCGRGVYYWAGPGFRPAGGEKLTSGIYLAALFGGPDRGVYATQQGDKDHLGKLYRLSDGQAILVSDFYYDDSGDRPCIYVSRTGRVFNWGRRFLAVLVDGKWKRIEAKLALMPVVVDAGQAVHFCWGRKLYSVDARGEFTERELPADAAGADSPAGTRVGALLGDDKMVLVTHDRRGLEVYDLKTLERVWGDGMADVFGKLKVFDCFRAADGSVWVFLQPPQGGWYAFYRIRPTGEAGPLPQNDRLRWSGVRSLSDPHAVLRGSDGSTWLAPEYGGIARWKEDALQLFGWKEGLAIEPARHLFEDPKGRIFAASWRSVWVYTPGLPRVMPAGLELWTEFAGRGPYRDGLGNIWTFLDDHPKQASRWDGREWHHVPIPFDGSKVTRAMGDDQGHLLVWMGDAPAGLYDVGPDGTTEHFEWPPNAMLESAVKRGARRFETGTDFSGCLVTRDGRIWFGYRHSTRFALFDGEQWDEFSMRDYVQALCESPRYGVIARTDDGRFYTYDRGQIVELAPPPGGGPWLFGPNSIQPYEEELLKQFPDLYVPVEKEGAVYYFLKRAAGAGKALTERIRGEAASPSPDWRPRRSLAGGFWVLDTPRRLFASRSIPVDFGETPLAARGPRSILDDRAGNLWVAGIGTDGTETVFCKRLDGFRLKLKEVPKEAGASVRVEAASDLPGLDARDLRLFYRLRGGEWQGGERGGSALVELGADGTWEIELVGMDPQGGVSKSEKIVVRSSGVEAGTAK